MTIRSIGPDCWQKVAEMYWRKPPKITTLDDGVLTAHEAMNLNFDKTELIVPECLRDRSEKFSKREGVFGLQRSFLVAGADAIVMSLFQVSDEVTQKLMVEFYKNWLDGQDKRTASQQCPVDDQSLNIVTLFIGGHSR